MCLEWINSTSANSQRIVQLQAEHDQLQNRTGQLQSGKSS